MTQQRIVTFGSLIETDDLPTVIASITSPGRYVGNDFEVAQIDLLRVTPGAALLPDGVLILESEAKEILVTNTSAPANYTIVYRLEDTTILGGSPAELALLPGISKQSDFTDSVVLGWLRYPGGSVPISENQFVQPSTLRVELDPARFYYEVRSPFPELLRDPSELRGAPTTLQIPLLDPLRTIALGGVRGRVLGAALLSTNTQAANIANYTAYSVKKGATQLLAASTSAAAITGGAPKAMTKTTGINTNFFVIDPTDVITVAVTKTGDPRGAQLVADVIGTFAIVGLEMQFTRTAGTAWTFTTNDIGRIVHITAGTNSGQQGRVVRFISGTVVAVEALRGGVLQAAVGEELDLHEHIDTDLSLAVELPGANGNFQESQLVINSEELTRFVNVDVVAHTLNLKLPFTMSPEGQPKKLVTRLSVDVNCIVTFKVELAGTLYTLSPGSGEVTSTGGVVTKELDIPVLPSNDGKMGAIIISANAQSGRGFSLGYIALTLEATPFILFP